MQKNVGTADKRTRLFAGAMLLLIGLFVPMNTILQVIVFVIAAIAFITGLVELCPLWKVLGISTRKEKKTGS